MNLEDKNFKKPPTLMRLVSLVCAIWLSIALYGDYGVLGAVGGFIVGCIPLIGPMALIAHSLGMF